MNVTERDILGVVHARNREGLRLRAIDVVKRSISERRWKVLNRVNYVLSIVFIIVLYVGLLGGMGLGFFGGDEYSELSSWLCAAAYLVISVGIFLFYLFYLFIMKVELKVIRRWPGNPLRIEHWENVNKLETVRGNDPPKAQDLFRHAYHSGYFKILRWADFPHFRIARYCVLHPKLGLAGFLYVILMLVWFLPRGLFSGTVFGEAEIFLHFPVSVFTFAFLWFAVSLHRKTISRHVPAILKISKCPDCKYDLQGTKRTAVEDGDQLRCPECGWNGVALPN